MAKKNILIIEDEKLLLDVLSKKLTMEGYNVIKASDGEVGLEQIRGKKIDLILLDMMLPRLDGYGVLEKMREEKIETPVIIVSNSGQPVDIERAFSLGVYDFLIKAKLNPEELIEKVNCFFALKEGRVCNKKGCRKILLVEDDKFLRDLCMKKLLLDGFHLDVAVDGIEAYQKIKYKRPSLVLLDVVMPGMDGFEVLEKVRSDKDAAIAKTPIIVFSNLGQETDFKKAMDLGANSFLVKADLDINTLGQTLAKFLK
jgi:putative two-component system response regulator